MKQQKGKPNGHSTDTRMLQKCQCGICGREEEPKPIPTGTTQCFEEVTELPYGQSLTFLIERLAETSVRLVERVKLNIPETFFFKESRVSAFCYTNNQGELTRSSHVVPLKKVEEIIMRRKAGSEEQMPSPKQTSHAYYSSVGEREERERKMRHEVAVIKLLNGGFTIVSEFNLPFEIQKARHIDYVQLYSRQETEFVKFDYVADRADPMYERAHIYSLIMRGEITDWDKQYISRADESNFQLELYRQDMLRLLQYLTFKLVHVLAFAKLQILKGRFDWFVNRTTASVGLFNAEGIQYCAAKPDGKIDIDQFKEMQEQRVEQRLLGLSARKTHYEFNHRVDDYQNILYQSYDKVKRSIIPSMPVLASLSESDVAFKKLHPDISDNLRDILRDKNKFTRTMRTIERGRTAVGGSRHRRAETLPSDPVTPEASQPPKVWLHKSRQRVVSVKDRREKFLRSVNKGLRTQGSLQESRIQVNLSRVLKYSIH